MLTNLKPFCKLRRSLKYKHVIRSPIQPIYSKYLDTPVHKDFKFLDEHADTWLIYISSFSDYDY